MQVRQRHSQSYRQVAAIACEHSEKHSDSATVFSFHAGMPAAREHVSEWQLVERTSAEEHTQLDEPALPFLGRCQDNSIWVLVCALTPSSS
ncbi:hypothetical protein ABBQ38_012688 [Trebouxia sp. C0009 RCD-2024]